MLYSNREHTSRFKVNIFIYSESQTWKYNINQFNRIHLQTHTYYKKTNKKKCDNRKNSCSDYIFLSFFIYFISLYIQSTYMNCEWQIKAKQRKEFSTFFKINHIPNKFFQHLMDRTYVCTDKMM